MPREIEGVVYQVRGTTRAMLVETSCENSIQDLVEFCAELTCNGFVITSVYRIFDTCSSLRIALLSMPEYKAAVRERRANKRKGKEQSIKKGDYVRTPRFCTVQIETVFQNEEAAREQGYTEPTHYDDGAFGILGKSIGENRMVFAAFGKE